MSRITEVRIRHTPPFEGGLGVTVRIAGSESGVFWPRFLAGQIL